MTLSSPNRHLENGGFDRKSVHGREEAGVGMGVAPGVEQQNNLDQQSSKQITITLS